MPATMPLERARRLALASALTAGLGGCASDAALKSKQDAEFMVLTSAYAVERNLGKGPVAIDDDDTLMRYQLYRRGTTPQYALVLFPDKVSGTIELDLGDPAAAAAATAAATAAASDGRYYDLVLRAHRLVLRADLDQARRLLDRIEGEFDVGYATLVLRGNVAILAGDPAQAARLFADARARLPERKDIDDAWMDDTGEAKP